MGRFPKPLTIGRCRGDDIDGLSSKELFERIRDLSLGLARARRARPAIASRSCAESRPEWMMCDMAILAAGAVTVPIYPTLSAAQARYILQDSGARLAIVSTRLQLEKLQEVRHLLPALEAVVVMEPAAAARVACMTLDEVARRGHARMTGEWGAGREFRDAARAVRPDDLATIIYTSGTTGEPKGVMLTHANLVANLRGGGRRCSTSRRTTSRCRSCRSATRSSGWCRSSICSPASRSSSPNRSTRSAATSRTSGRR